MSDLFENIQITIIIRSFDKSKAVQWICDTFIILHIQSESQLILVQPVL